MGRPVRLVVAAGTGLSESGPSSTLAMSLAVVTAELGRKSGRGVKQDKGSPTARGEPGKQQAGSCTCG